MVDPLEQAIFELIRQRKPNSFCPSEVVRWIYPEDWRHFMPDVHKTMMDLYRQRKISVTQKGIPIDPNFLPKGPVRIQSNDIKDDAITENND
ncbi:MAG TPA: DUF3253 domain-containing protein [Lunatimonas sp.]|nr:DUF3253 domain-containing protein [Lunatimonas sp.]